MILRSIALIMSSGWLCLMTACGTSSYVGVSSSESAQYGKVEESPKEGEKGLPNQSLGEVLMWEKPEQKAPLAQSPEVGERDLLSSGSATPPSKLSASIPINPPVVSPPVIEDVFFDFDKAGIRLDAQRTLESNAEILEKKYLDASLLLEGHCDERGSEEYNLVLGERRAQAVKEYLIDLGLPATNIHIISYGKEKPFCFAHEEGCWQRNRRAHFTFR